MYLWLIIPVVNLFVKMHLEILLITLLWGTSSVHAIKSLKSLSSHEIANVGKPLRLKCSVTDISTQTVHWRILSTKTIISFNRDISAALPTDMQDRYSIVGKDDSQFTLRISNIKESDEDVYQCGYTNNKEDKFKSFGSINVTVQSISTNEVNPLCSLDPPSESSILTNSSSVTFTCSISNNSMLTGGSLQWVRDGHILKSKNENTLSISLNVSLNDINKLFICQVHNTNSKTDIKECSIRTSENPITLSKETNNVKLSSNVSITCNVRSSSDSPSWDSPNKDILKRFSLSNRNQTLCISNVTLSDNNTDIVCSFRNYTKSSRVIVYLEKVTRESTTAVLGEYTPTLNSTSENTTKGVISDSNSIYPTSSGDNMGFPFNTAPMFMSTEYGIQEPYDTAIIENTKSLLNVTNSPPPKEVLSGFQEFLQMLHMSYRVFIAAAIGTFVLLVLLLILAVCCYKYVQSKKPARLAISDSFYSGLANVHKNTNYPVHYNAMHKRGFGHNSTASSLCGEDDIEGGNLLDIIVQGKFPESCETQFSDTLEHCNADYPCLSPGKDSCNLNTSARDYETSADTLDGTDEGIGSGSAETGFDFDFESPMNTKQSKCSHLESEEDCIKDTLC